jgi:signal transduction histidine kinase
VLVGGLYQTARWSAFSPSATAIVRPPMQPCLRLLAGVAQRRHRLRNARLLEEVREASALKSEWVGAISHELRTPLNAMLGYLEMLLDGALGDVTAPQDDALRRTQQYAFGLLEMITAVLDLNRLEAGRISVNRTTVSVRALLEEVRQQVPDHWRRLEVDLRLVLPASLPEIETDKGKLKIVIRNLLHNASSSPARPRTHRRSAPGGRPPHRRQRQRTGIPPDT